MTTAAFYAQTPLIGRAIRLLFIHPSSDRKSRIHCRCVPYRLDKAPEYEALSYVWGDQTERIEISCNDEIVTVGRSLGEALLRLRRNDSTRVIWADALCIDQSSSEEKNHQVPLMRDIFSSAIRVVVDLGSNILHSLEVVCCLESIAQACRVNGIRYFSDYSQLRLPSSWFTCTVCVGLRDFYDNSWFRRVWCVQEVRLAQEAIVLCGLYELNWDDVGIATSWLFDYAFGSDLNYPPREQLLSLGTGNASAMFGKEQSKLVDILKEFRSFEATDPRDKIYGLLSLAELESGPSKIVVDYDKTPGEVFADTALVLIRLTQSLDVLAHVVHPEKYRKINWFPSWVPDWSDVDTINNLANPQDQCATWHQPHFVVDCGLLDESSPGCLLLRGVTFDTVVSIHDTADSYDLRTYHNYYTGMNHKSQAMIAIYKSVGTPCIDHWTADTNQQRWDILARTLSFGEMSSSTSETTNLAGIDVKVETLHLVKLMHALINIARRTRGNRIDIPVIYEVMEIEKGLAVVCDERRIFWTKSGVYGLGPQCMRPGDIVIILFGGKTPFILRPQGDQYLFMGAAYIDCLMTGAVEVNLDEDQQQVFCLI